MSLKLAEGTGASRIYVGGCAYTADKVVVMAVQRKMQVPNSKVPQDPEQKVE